MIGVTLCSAALSRKTVARIKTSACSLCGALSLISGGRAFRLKGTALATRAPNCGRWREKRRELSGRSAFHVFADLSDRGGPERRRWYRHVRGECQFTVCAKDTIRHGRIHAEGGGVGGFAALPRRAASASFAATTNFLMYSVSRGPTGTCCKIGSYWKSCSNPSSPGFSRGSSFGGSSSKPTMRGSTL